MQRSAGGARAARTSVFVVLFMGFLRKPGVLDRPSWTLQAGPVVRPAASINSSPPGPSAFDILSPPTLEHPCSSSCPPRHFWPWRALCSGAQEVRELRDFLSGTSATFVSPVQHQFSPYAQTAGKAVELLRISQSVLPPNSWRPALVAAYMIVVQIVLSPPAPRFGLLPRARCYANRSQGNREVRIMAQMRA